MKDILSRLRAALTPQMMLLAAALLTAYLLAAGAQQETPLEMRISQTLSSMEGAGRVVVTIRTRELTLNSAFGAAQKEIVPCGAVAVAQGADDPLVALELREALCALLGLSASSVSIVAGGR